MPARAILLDFYGTLARATHAVTLQDVMARHGYALPPDMHDMWWSGDLDGIEHPEPSRSREHYVAWQQERLLAMLAAADVHPGEYELVLDELHAGRGERVLEPYPEVTSVLKELEARRMQRVVCSNWDWDLEPAIAEAGLDGLVDVIVSSAWIGARKPHPRIFRHTLDLARVGADDVLFVGDTWGPDVEGPRAVGIRAAYLEREGHWPDPTRPEDPAESIEVAVVRDLTEVLDLLDLP